MLFSKTFEKLKQGLAKTRGALTRRLRDLFSFIRKIDDDFLQQLEELMIAADMGMPLVNKIITGLKQAYKEGKIKDSSEILPYLKNQLTQTLQGGDIEFHFSASPPTVVLVVGVNGTGKTTSIAKLAYLFKSEGKKVLLAASDTFRAAAIEQLEIWSQRVKVDIVKHKSGADPGAVAYDACEAAQARGVDVLIVDTAGRLHTKVNLMRELSKISSVIAKKIPGAPHEVLLVLDATTGQNAIAQAKTFSEAARLTGIFLAKLDGTAKGAVICAIRDQLNIPVKFVGIGEKTTDIEKFDAAQFVEALFD